MSWDQKNNALSGFTNPSIVDAALEKGATIPSADIKPEALPMIQRGLELGVYVQTPNGIAMAQEYLIDPSPSPMKEAPAEQIDLLPSLEIPQMNVDYAELLLTCGKCGPRNCLGCPDNPNTPSDISRLFDGMTL